MHRESFREALHVDQVAWVKDPQGPASPWHVDQFDDDGEAWARLSGPAFSRALRTFAVYRKRFTFGADGACVRVPSMKSPPAAVRVRTFPVIEQSPLVWVYLGDPARDEAMLEAVQETMSRDPRGAAAPEVSVKADAAAVQARRIVQRWVARETG